MKKNPPFLLHSGSGIHSRPFQLPQSVLEIVEQYMGTDIQRVLVLIRNITK